MLRILRQVLVAMVLLGALGAAAWYGNRWYVHASAVDAAVAPLVGAYVGHGFLDSQRAMFSLVGWSSPSISLR